MLVNDSTSGKVQFRDIAAEHAVQDLGMVTAAQWADVDGDDWPDLVTTSEWGRVRLFLNREGRLSESTAHQGFTEDLGLWTALAVKDVDGDGDPDIVAGNLGFNTKYKATREKPELLFYGDVDGSGQPRILEAKYEGDRCLPRRGYSCSSNAMPSLRKRLTNFHAFASGTLDSIYTPTRLQQAERLEANTLASCLYLNDGRGHFSAAVPLPRLAQSFPVFGIAVHDFTKDGQPDIYLIGNSYSPQRETGNMDGGVSLLLKGTKDPASGIRFEPVWPNESGLVVRGDAKALVITDLNGDQRQDVIVGINQGALQGFLAR